ncbi:efflux RND transporter periplasmic adaptor subunit [Pseudomonas sp. N040]|uniref:efflux RND transporter periplasmic adaptor subunit n=1 Tax=Pseudomonas sp. N040 TaxID=2785325 RepID=UPI0018A2BB35|nr:efflux RND transporter periplasmic adaptor subunit [Pseudomonas sp. N040]MBF7731704.1 efflux RND transporter periplasmic adaptor subunit [Pseudomonas sp. N040]MBW7015348.1 efflux RND transporter periplasmic adaptor subunit [Pseudomonas sp. N040]
MNTTPLSVAVLLLAMGATQSLPAWAHGDEVHAEAAPVTSTGNNPQRLADGRVLLPKEAQHRLAVRTVLARETSVAKSIELNGHVVMDPNRGGQVQASSAGRISAPAQGLPALGSRISKGQLLAWVIPTVSAYEQAQQQAELAQIRSQLTLAQLTVQRLYALRNSVPGKELQAAEAELAALRGRSAALAAVSQGEALRAPVAGVLAASNVLNGQVVAASDVLFVIVDPEGMQIEALAYDPALVDNLAGAFMQGVSLRYLGGALVLRDGALPLRFAPTQAMPLALGQTVKLIAQTREQISGVVLPASSVVKNSANESVVWLHEQALVFRAVPVQPVALDGKNVLVTQIRPGSRVVTAAASLLNQIR